MEKNGRIMEKLKVLSLFAGIGGFDLGLERTGGFEAVAFCEIDPFCQKVLAKNWPHVPCFSDVRELCGEQVGEVDVICGGFPCQDLSVSGSRIGIDGERSGLWIEYARLIGELRPSHVIVENSPNLLVGGHGRWFGRVLGDLAAIGYDAEWDIIPASALGAPHKRERLWIAAYPSGKRHSQSRRYHYAFNSKAEAYREANTFVELFHRGKLPVLCGRHDGVSGELGKNMRKQYGNAVIPQIPEMIGHAILESIGWHP